MAVHDLNAPDTIVQLAAANDFWAAVDSVTDRRVDRNIRRDILASFKSLNHKLNAIRYNAALIQTLSEDDYADFIHPPHQGYASNSNVQFQHLCTLEMHNRYEYHFILTSLVENLSAAAFSLFDVSAHLLNDVFDLQIPGKINYKKALQNSALQGYATLHDYLLRHCATPYSPMTPSPNLVNWVGPLEQVRHRMTHRQITDILRSDNDGNLTMPDNNRFLVNENFFPSSQAENLKTFAERCYVGLVEFVTKLYEQLIDKINNAGTVPV